jgi:hypothetical protein
MRGKVLLLTIGAVLLVGIGGAGGVYIWLQSSADRALQAGVDTLKSHLPEAVKLDIAGMTTHPLSRSAELTHLTVAAAGSSATFGRIVFSGLSIGSDGAVGFAHVTLHDIALEAPGGVKATVGTIGFEGVLSSTSVAADGVFPIRNVEIGGATLDAATISSANFAGTVTVGQVTAGVLKDGTLARLALHDLHLAKPAGADGEAIDVTIREAGVTSVDVASLVDGSFLRHSKNLIADAHVADLGAAKGDSRLKLASADFAVTARGDDGEPTAMHFAVEGMSFVPSPAAQQIVTLLKQLGRPDLALSLHADSKQDNATHTITVSETASFDGMGDVGVDMAMGNFPSADELRKLQGTDPAALLATVTLGPTRFGWADHGLVPALERQVGAAASLDQIATLGEFAVRKSLASAGLADMTADWPGKIGVFLRKPGQIELQLDPVEGAPLALLLNAAGPPATKFGMLKPSLVVTPAP